MSGYRDYNKIISKSCPRNLNLAENWDENLATTKVGKAHDRSEGRRARQGQRIEKVRRSVEVTFREEE